METDNIRVLVVDDSAVVRALISDHITATPGMSVVGVARNGREALAAAESLHPDVMTLDVQMPGMDGLEVLDRLLDKNPIPVVMVSSLTKAGATITLDALDRGATDYVAKPEHGAAGKALFVSELTHKIRTAAGVNIPRLLARRKRQATATVEAAQVLGKKKAGAEDCPPEFLNRCIAIGISTGGPPALTKVLTSLRPPLPPIVIVQHMPPQFTGPLASRLNSISPLTVREAVQGDKLQPNVVLVAPGGTHLELRGKAPHVSVLLKDGPVVSGHKPSVDVMMTCAAEVFGSSCMGVIMTGMGRDGVAGCGAIRTAGGYVLGQNEATSDVYGMNRAAYVEGNVDRQFGLQDGAAVIMQQVKRLWSTTSVLQ